MLAVPVSQLGPLPRAAMSPELDPDSDEETDMIVVIPEIFKSPSECTVCRICLTTEGRMERVTEKYETAYKEVSGIKWDKKDSLPQHICWECSHRLICALRLKQTALTAQSILLDLRNGHSFLTLNDILQIDRNYHHLSSKLSPKHFPPNEYMSQINVTNQKTQQISKPLDEEVETEDAKRNDAADTFDKVDENIDDSIATIVKDFIDKASDDSSDCLIIDDIEKEPTDTAVGQIEASAPDGDLERVHTLDEKDVLLKRLLSSEPVLGRKGEILEIMPRFEKMVDSGVDAVATDAVNNVSNDEGMAIDDLIEIYNNDEDGDGRLQELNEHYGEASVQLDQCWGGQGQTKGMPNEDAALRIPRLENISRAYAKLDRSLFTITPVSEQEQIAEVRKRQETYRFKRAPFKCILCFLSFHNRGAYDRHMLRHDAANGEYECTICHARQKSERAMKSHMHGQHSMRVACRRCAFVTMNRSVARGHQKWHAGTIYRCPHCPSQFNQETTYKVHLRTQHAHAHVCSLCGFTFGSAKGLAVHRCKRHADADKIPLRGPWCDTCQVRFVSEEAYSRHLKLSSRHLADDAPSLIELRMAGN